MHRLNRSSLFLFSGMVLGSVIAFGQSRTVFGAASGVPVPNGAPAGQAFPGFGGPFVQSYFYPDPYYGYYGGYFSPFLYLPSSTPPYPYMPNQWWVSPYPVADPRQDGYNPAGGYPKETVATLLLSALPTKSRVTLDGTFIGTSDALGPIQLPKGEHTLRVDAAGYEPSETVLKIEQPTLEQLDIRLTPKAKPEQPAPRP